MDNWKLLQQFGLSQRRQSTADHARYRRRRATPRVAWLLAALFLLAPAAAFGQQDPRPTADDQVSVTIDYGDGVQKRFTAIPWKAEMTVLDAMKAAEKHPRGIRMTYRGSGSTALLTKIDNLENEGRGRNWIYRVNEKLADRSFGIFELEAGDRVVWRFERYQPGR